MCNLLVIILFNLITTNGLTDTSLPDCECITKWSITDIACSSNTITTIQSYLSLHKPNCLEMCDENPNCQQAFSLLTQYYHYCPLGSVSQDIFNKFINNSTCDDCKMDITYTNQNLKECSDTNCTGILLIQSIDYITQNCTKDLNITDKCTTECQNKWDIISSYQRQCEPYPLDYLFDVNINNCLTDCNIESNTQFSDITSKNDEFTSFIDNCPNMYINNTKLDIIELEKHTKLCFYGLNINNPTQYDLICIATENINSSGIIKYNRINSEINDSFWSSLANAKDMDILWIQLCGGIVFFMQLGFALLEGGAVKAGNVQNIMFKNLMDAAICALVYWLVGYCVAYGDPTSVNANGFMGVESIVIEDETWGAWFFHMSFACTASTIVSGAVAERFRLEPYFIYTIFVSSWIYPVVVHWIWSETGWLSPFNKNVIIFGGAIDFAGSSCVHMIGGLMGICGAYFVGPRLERFDQSKAATKRKYYKELHHQFEFGHSVPYQVVGLLVLWFGFYGFNCGSTELANFSMDLASKIAVNTTVSAASGGITSAFISKWTENTWHIPKLCNGILAALASITASCAVVGPGFAILIGFIGACLYCFVSKLMITKFQIDDPLDAFAVHGIGGIWGVLSAGLFATNESLKFANYPESLYADTNVGERIAANLILIVAVIGWTLAHGIVLFGIMGCLNILRVSEQMERTGIDVVEHGGHALNMSKTYSISVQKAISNKKKKYQFSWNNDNQSGKEHYRNESGSKESDGNFAEKIRESSLERRLHGVAEVDEHGVFPT